MATETQTRLIDDLDGSEASHTIHFSLDHKSYVVDMNEDNARRVREQFQTLIEAGRPVKNGKTKASKSTRNTESPKIRKWAREQGYDVPQRGRIPEELVQAYHAS